jgi:hypothetical protein
LGFVRSVLVRSYRTSVLAGSDDLERFVNYGIIVLLCYEQKLEKNIINVGTDSLYSIMIVGYLLTN